MGGQKCCPGAPRQTPGGEGAPFLVDGTCGIPVHSSVKALVYWFFQLKCQMRKLVAVLRGGFVTERTMALSNSKSGLLGISIDGPNLRPSPRSAASTVQEIGRRIEGAGGPAPKFASPKQVCAPGAALRAFAIEVKRCRPLRPPSRFGRNLGDPAEDVGRMLGLPRRYDSGAGGRTPCSLALVRTVTLVVRTRKGGPSEPYPLAMPRTQRRPGGSSFCCAADS